MPKERIQHGEAAYETDTEGSLGTPSLDVTWMRDPTGHVQIAIEMTREQWIANADHLRADDRISARAIYTESLNRREINHMIKTLRRARDAAYGADE